MFPRTIAIVLLLLLAGTTLVAQKKKERVSIEEGQNYLVLSTKKISTMEKELDEVAAKGFTVLYSAPTQQLDMALFLTRNEETIANPYSYKILATTKIKTMQKEIDEFAHKGYRFLPRTAIFKSGLFTAEFVAVLERRPNPRYRYEYKLIVGRKEIKVHSEIEKMMAEGFKDRILLTLAGE